MTFQWSDYLLVADDLLKLSSEGHHRSSASRAYYGVFGSIRQALEARRGRRFSGGRVHIAVINALKGDVRLPVQQLGQDLDRLRRERNRADYEATVRFTQSNAVRARQLAGKIEAGRSVL